MNDFEPTPKNKSEQEPRVLRATKSGGEYVPPKPTPFLEVHKKRVANETSDDERKELEVEIEKLAKEAEEQDVIRWREVKAGVLAIMKKNRWDDVYPDLIRFARDQEDEAANTAGFRKNPERYTGLVETAIKMAALEVSTQGMRRRGRDPDFVAWLARHGKTPGELREDERFAERGKILDLTGVDLPDLVGQALRKRAEEERVARGVPEEEEKGPQIVKIEAVREAIGPKDEENLAYKAEKAYLEAILTQLGRFVEEVGDNQNVFYDRNQLEGIIEFMRGHEKWLKESIPEGTRLLGREVPQIAERAVKRAEKLREWVAVNTKTLLSAGPVLSQFYDALDERRGMLVMVANPLRFDIKTEEMGIMYALFSPVELPNKDEGQRVPGALQIEGGWRLGEELIRKGSETFSIMRTIAKAHRHRGRNGGREITPQFRIGKEGNKVEIKQDYPASPRQIEFIERVFGRYGEPLKPGDDKREWKGLPRKDEPLFAIDKVWTGEGGITELIAELKNFFESQGKKEEGRRKEEVTVWTGKEHEVSAKVLRQLKNFFESQGKKEEGRLGKNPENLGGNTMWVDGIEWPINPDTLKELRWRVGSGDKVFVGDKLDVGKDNFEEEVKKAARGGRSIATTREIPPGLDNLYVILRVAGEFGETQRKIALILNANDQGEPRETEEEMPLWKSLKKENVEVDIEALAQKVIKKAETHPPIEVLDKHIIDMARIVLLWSLEGGELGWGFEYEKATLGEKKDKQGNTIDPGTDVIKRKRVEGGPKSATDITTAFHIVKTMAGDTLKNWPKTVSPMDRRIAKQIYHHEMGWAPGLNPETGSWRTECLGIPFDVNIPTKYDLNLFNVARVNSGTDKDKTAFEITLDGREMSEIPYWNMNGDAFYGRGYIDWNQIRTVLNFYKEAPGEDLFNFFGPLMFDTPRPGAAEKYNKRLWLGVRNLAGHKDVGRIMAYQQANILAWRMNLLPSSPNRGRFLPNDVERVTENVGLTLRGFSPLGAEAGMGPEMEETLKDHMGRYLKVGKKLKYLDAVAKQRKVSLDELVEEESEKALEQSLRG